MLKNKIGEIVVWDILDILRSHFKEYYHPAKGSMKDICMHYGGITRAPMMYRYRLNKINRKAGILSM